MQTFGVSLCLVLLFVLYVENGLFSCISFMSPILWDLMIHLRKLPLCRNNSLIVRVSLSLVYGIWLYCHCHYLWCTTHLWLVAVL